MIQSFVRYCWPADVYLFLSLPVYHLRRGFSFVCHGMTPGGSALLHRVIRYVDLVVAEREPNNLRTSKTSVSWPPTSRTTTCRTWLCLECEPLPLSRASASSSRRCENCQYDPYGWVPRRGHAGVLLRRLRLLLLLHADHLHDMIRECNTKCIYTRYLRGLAHIFS